MPRPHQRRRGGDRYASLRLTLVSMAGTGWSCSSNVCTRSGCAGWRPELSPITVHVNVLVNATSPLVNQVSVSGGGSASASWSDSTVISIGTPTLTVNRSRLNFGYSGSLITSPQTVTVNISGGLNTAWSAASDRSNVTVSPASGNRNRYIPGNRRAAIRWWIEWRHYQPSPATGATGSPQQVQVNVTSVTPAAPFGSFDTSH